MRWNAITRHKSWDPLIPAILSPGRLARVRNSSGDQVMIINAHVLRETIHVSLGLSPFLSLPLWANFNLSPLLLLVSHLYQPTLLDDLSLGLNQASPEAQVAITRNVTMFTSPRSPHLHVLSLAQCRRSAMTRSVLGISQNITVSLIRLLSCSLVARIRIADDLRISDEQECVVIRHSGIHNIYCTASRYISVSSPE